MPRECTTVQMSGPFVHTGGGFNLSEQILTTVPFHDSNVYGSPMSLQIPLHSLILNIQRSNELYKNIKFPYIRRLKIHQNIFFSNLLVLIHLTSDLILWGSMMILLSGDVEVNPGPDSAEDTSFTSDDQSLTSFETLSNHLSVFHLNIQSLVPKIDIVRSEADAYDILVFSESWLNPNISNDNLMRF